MPLAFRVDVAARLVRFEASGRLSSDDIAKALLAMTEHPGFEPGFSQLCDLTGAVDTDLTSDRLRGLIEVAAHASERIGDSALAIVASEAVFFGLARMYEMLAEDLRIRIRVFRDRDEALLWLRTP